MSDDTPDPGHAGAADPIGIHGAVVRPGESAPVPDLIDRHRLQPLDHADILADIELAESIKDHWRSPSEDPRWRPILGRLRMHEAYLKGWNDDPVVTLLAGRLAAILWPLRRRRG